MFRQFRQPLWIVFGLLAACGGGGSNAPGDPAPPPVQAPPPGAVAPSITTQPANQSVLTGASATFNVVATGTDPLTYQWQKAGAAIADATSASYTTGPASAADDGAMFSVVVSNPAGNVTSNGAKLTVTSTAVAPSITAQPANQSVAAGTTATFTVVATGTAPLSYQWKKGATNIAGATSASYTTGSVSTADDGAMFSVVVSNTVGNITSSSAKLTVTSTAVAPSITTQPANQSVASGSTATFSVIATGTAPLTYQWKKGATNIAGATSASYTTPATAQADNGSTFSVVVSNSVGSITSAAATLTVTTVATSSIDVTTYKYDASRSGANLSESVLTPANVTSAKFGLRYNLVVDGRVNAQPLYLSNLMIGGSARDVVFVATEHDSVYAFDANSGAKQWQVSLLGSGETLSDRRGCNAFTPEIGITSTPVIDRDAGPHGAMYVVAMSMAGTTYHQRLHALDVTTGAELFGGPVEITATFSGAGSPGTTFDPGQHSDRAALLLTNGTLYTSWASHCDIQPYSGWIIGFNPTTLARTAVLDVAPNSGGLGPAIWMSGNGPAADAAGNIYVATANGVFESTLDDNGFPTKQDYGQSFLKLTNSGGTLKVADYFTMWNVVASSQSDLDLGASGLLLLPDLKDATGTVRRLAVGAGKDRVIYVVDRDQMGRFNASTNNIWQQLSGVLTGQGLGTPAYYNGTLYMGNINGTLKAFTIANAKLPTTPTSQTPNQFRYPGTSPSVSANGTSNGIVWAYESTNPAVLHAYDASDLSRELYNSEQAANGRDRFGIGSKFMVPTVAEGKVFIGSTDSVGVFGLLP